MGNAQYIPPDDAFTENATTYGFSPTRYLRCEPYTAGTVFFAAANWELGVYHDGYMSDVASGGPAACVEDSGTARNTVGVLERSIYRADAVVYLQPAILLPSGTEWSDTTFRMCGVMGRVSGGSVISPGSRNEYHQATDGYVFMYHHRPTANWWLYSLVRVNAGAVTELTSIDVGATAGTGSPNHRTHPDSNNAPTRMWMSVRGSGATVQIRCYRRRMGYGVNGYIDEEILSYDDTDNPGRITAAGRWGFGVQSAGTDSSGTDCVGVAREFTIFDTQSTPNLLYCDLFERRQPKMGRLVTDALSETGYSVMGAFTGDGEGPDGSGLEHHSQFIRDGAVSGPVAGDQVDLGDSLLTGQDWGWYISTRPSDGNGTAFPTNQHRSVDVRFRNAPTIDREAGIALRFTSLNTGTYNVSGADADKRCYCAVLIYDGTGASFSVELRHYSGGGAHSVIASASTVPTSVTFNAIVSLDFEVQNTDPPGLRPAMRVKLDGTAVTFTSGATGVDVFGDWVVDGRTNAIKSISAVGEGLYYDGPAVAATARMLFDNWTQEAVSDINIDDGGNDTDTDEQASVVVRGETSGKFGELTVPKSWPVRESHEWYRKEFRPRSGHRIRYADAGQERRSFRIMARAVEDSDRDDLIAFLEEHGGSELPFDWTHPRTNEVIACRFATPATTLTLLERGTDGFDFDLVEAFNGLGGGTQSTVSFDPISVSGTSYVQFYEEQTAAYNVTITAQLDVAAPIGGLEVGYTVNGTAVAGTHYNITAGVSPLSFAVGETSKTITVQILPTTAWTRTRSLLLEFDPTAGNAAINTLANAVHMYIRPSVDPPIIEFSSASGSHAGGQVHNIATKFLTGSPDTDEDIDIYWEVDASSTATQGTDFTFPTASGSVVWPAGDSTSAIPVQISGDTGAVGKTIVLNLKHENGAAHASYVDPNARQTFHEDENFYTYCDDLRYVDLIDGSASVWQFSGEPADHARGPAGCLSQQFQSGVLHTWEPDGGKRTARGTPMNILYAKPGTPCDGYHRKDFDKEVSCDGPTQAQAFRTYQRFSVKVELPTLNAPVTGYSRYVRLSIFDRVGGYSYAIRFDRESTDGGAVVTSTGSWLAEEPSNTDWGSAGSGPDSDYGIDENADGETVLWILHHEATKAPGSLGHNRIIYPVNEGPGQNSSNWDGRGLCFYDPRLEYSDVSGFSGPPGDDYWVKPADWWEPRGQATIRNSGVSQYTITIT